MIIIGSQALLTNLRASGDQPFRRPVDLDVIATEAEMMGLVKRHSLPAPRQIADYKFDISPCPGYGHIDVELMEKSESGRLYDQWMDLVLFGDVRCLSQVFYKDVYDLPVRVAPYEVLYSIKRSHRHYPRAFHKHIADYHLLKSIVQEDRLAEITKIRERETQERYGDLKTPSLKMSKQDFFTDNVSNRVFVHDDIHAVMAHKGKPMYEYYAMGDGTVRSDKNKFFALPFAEQCWGVLEEAYVIALERAIIPMMFSGGPPATPRAAFDWAIMRICTTLTSGWFRNFATENYPLIYSAADMRYADKFFEAVAAGRIRRIGTSAVSV